MIPFCYAQEDSAAQEADSADSAAAYDTYIIQSGDTLFVIARRFNTTVEALMSVNAITDARRIVAGQLLLVPAQEVGSAAVYEVQAGDTLYSISRAFNTSVSELRRMNNLVGSSTIVTGQNIRVPAVDESGDEAEPEAGQTIREPAVDESSDEAAPEAGQTIREPAAAESSDEAEPETEQTIREPEIAETLFDTHVVKPDDTLEGIAESFDTTVETLMALNGIAADHDLEAGQSIRLPRAGDARYANHVVQPGDTLYDLSRLYNTTVAQLRRLNGIEVNEPLAVGRSIIVPSVDEALFERYIVQPGDSLYGIARRFGVDLQALQMINRLANIRDIKVDQAILVPKLEGASLAVHVIQAGDTLEEIAAQYETTVQLLQTLNGIADPSLIVLGKTILVPEPAEITTRPGFGFGIHIFADGSPAADLAQAAKELGADWVKIDVSWAEIETAPKVYSYSALDAMIASMELAGLKIMLNVYAAPEWSRAGYLETLNSQFRDYAGPPEDYDDFANFLANLVIRYAGLVEAYEIWKSPNLLKYWTAPVYTRPQEMTADGDYGIPDEIQLGARYYVPLLEIAFNTIKAHDEEALVVAAGLAPVGFNDNYNSIDTETFLNNMLQEGAADVSDAIGAIFSASAVPPTFACCDKPPGVDTHYESFLQYYGDLLAFYAETLVEHGVERPVIVTQLGWGTAEGANLALPAAGFEWLKYTSEAEQALYVTQAFQIAQQQDYISAIFLYNLNGCAAGDEEACFFSLQDANGRRRPAFAAYQSVPKSITDA